MKQRIQGMLIGVIVTILFANTLIYASTGETAAKIFYNNIKIYVDGGKLVPKDANGKEIEPFTMNGTTYLPVRAVANALGKDVYWDGATQSIYLGKVNQNKPDTYLDKLQYSNYQEGQEANNFSIITNNITDYVNNEYTSGVTLFVYRGDRPIADEPDSANAILTYPLNSQYKKITGNIVVPKTINKNTVGNNGTEAVTVYFYGDNRLLYKANNVIATMPFDFDIDVTGVNSLDIKIVAKLSTGYDSVTYALTNLALYK